MAAYTVKQAFVTLGDGKYHVPGDTLELEEERARPLVSQGLLEGKAEAEPKQKAASKAAKK